MAPSRMSQPYVVVDHLPWDADVAITSERTYRLNGELASLADCARLADRLDCDQLWLHQRWHAAHPSVQLDAWQRLPTDAPRGYSMLAAPWQGQHEGFGPLAVAQDGHTLARALCLLHGALSEGWHGTPGATGIAMLEKHLARRGLLEPPELPPPAYLPAPEHEPDFGWQRRPLEHELGLRWLHCFDRHAMYLLAAETVECGYGAWQLVEAPAFQARAPGYWQVRYQWQYGDLPLPSPARPPRSADGWQWLSTPSVEALLSVGTGVEIRQAYLWPEHGRLLQFTAARLRFARTALQRGDSAAHDLALATLKAIYTQTLGGYLARRKLPDSDPVKRPDWRDFVKAEARTRLWYIVRNVWLQTGIAPLAIATDAIYMASNESAPERVIDLPGFRFGAGAGQWHSLGRAPFDELAPLLTPSTNGAFSRRFRELAER
jgi:hypothetical protein